MYELIKVGEKSYYVNCPAKIGIYKSTENGVYLIDSGNDKDAGKKVRRILDENGWHLLGIINTHSHADHIGGNGYLQNQTGCKVFANGIEAAFTNYPVLEPAFLFGGFPAKDLRHKFLLAAESRAVDFSDNDFPNELEIISLGGHSFDMAGIITPDGTAFIADCVSSEATLEKYKISFIYDIESYLKTLDALENIKAKIFVPAHAEVTQDIVPLAQLNRKAVFEVAEKIKQTLCEPICFEMLLKKIFDLYNLKMTFEQYVLVGSTVKSYLSWLKGKGEITAEFKENVLLWKSGT